ncbi:MAG: hypothetical protein JWO76_902, partial [Nocardioides sp.]|nr:hypothetical protein [Nocardioides sp.]
HSNDSILMTDGTSSPNTGKGPHFYGTVTTSMPSCNREGGRTVLTTDCYRSGNSPSAGHPVFDKGIGYRSEVDIPQSIGDLRQVVVRGQDSPVTLGCLYTGPTRIQFLAASGSAAPTMKVWSPYSDPTRLNPGCAGTASGSTSAWPRIVPVPQNNLIMVQDVPSTQLPLPPSGACAAGSLGTVPDTSTGTDLPNADDWNQALDDASCRYGTAYVEGTLKGRVTISTDNNIVVVGNLLYQGGPNGTDALGLIAENSVQIYHPVSKTQSCKDQKTWNGQKWVTTTVCTWVRGTSNLTGSLKNPEVDASILTLNHSFEVQQYDVGSNSCVSGSSACLGKLRVYGSIAQKFRGIVGRGSTGYLKDYNYDSRLRYAPPPYFLDPVRSAWGQKTFGEVAPRYGG